MKRKLFILITSIALFTTGCKDELAEVVNKNEPNEAALNSEAGLAAFAKGGVYMSSFGVYYASIDDQLGSRSGKNLGYFTTMVYGLHESMGDVIYVPWGNQSFRYANNPTDFTLDDGSLHLNPIGISQPYELRLRNDRAYGAANTLLMEWTPMYFLNNAMNILLGHVDEATFTGDAATKQATLRAWAYWWKGYAYSRIGSMYIAGVITDEPNQTNGDFVTHEEIIDEALKNFDKAIAELNNISDTGPYGDLLATVIPGYCQQGKGGIPMPDEWIRNINTMKARSLLVNKRVSEMTSSDWSTIAALTDEGIQESDPVFVVKTTEDFNRSVIDPNFGSAAAYTATESGQTFFVSERLIQDFRAGDQRMENNFELLTSPRVNMRGRGLGFGTRYYLVDGGNNLPGVVTYTHTDQYGVDDTYLGGSFEENELMKAEVLIQGGNISGGTAVIDNVRAMQGAGLTAIGSVNKLEALEELRRERRIALLFRGLAFYDLRRLGVVDDKSEGGGRANAVVLSNFTGSTVVNTKAFINYNYMSYFDVPKNELEFNEPKEGSAPVVGPQ
ncbi:RagB/SusD family nutrient uptake outer membrane protein [Chryseolinea sp. T2]|uniref:RagB/SusD family nutrient uptake outer membrane protein n=1 Tax=Chryseolinea sp. T2 TaxID=3129255 RepID=UPI0030789E24